ncbi:hypothetical protein [Bifidobacterium samirii]|uniref:Uncharacterized protein n=1 Tax=Bifidobacterium samirii TaxID=2306974 RepID=A0A430FCP4_9BIFI|nr:hypothetical protein [Bifidobacterium samirii]RSX50606.1 hypothetical protein D2E24_1955 [Bifidobacterium samirii]
MTNTYSLTDLLQIHDDDDLDIVPMGADDLDSPERIERQRAEGVKRGQVWLASDYGCGLNGNADDGDADDGDADSLYVMIADTDADDPRTVRVIPLSNDLRAETDDALVVEQGAPLGIPMVAWPTIPAIIPVRLLYKPLKQFTPATADAIIADDPAKADPSDTVRRGKDSDRNDSPFVENREDTIAILLAWHAMCAELPQLGAESDGDEYAIDEALVAYTNALKTVLHLSPQDYLAVSRGRSLTSAQQKAMAKAGFPEQPRKKETIDDAYLIMAEQPQWRIAADKLAATGNGDPRMALAHKAQFELAARRSGRGADVVASAMRAAADGVLGKRR